MNYMLHLTTVDKETYKPLQKLNGLELISSQFALAGCTSLYLQIGPKRSIHLNFFSPVAFDVRELEITLAATHTSILNLLIATAGCYFGT